jgi:endonuclease-3
MDEQYWEQLFSRLRHTIGQQGGPLPSVSTIAAENQDPYRVLVSTLLSLRTKDEVTLQASRNLFSLASTPEQMLLLDERQIGQAIFPAGFYKTKARNILAISKILVERYGGKVPASAKTLMELPGVGIKTANLTLNLGFGIDAICVDCHVHQIANRMGWVSTKTPEQTEKALQAVMPRRFWIPLNELLVRYGQQVCTSVSPKCSLCSEQGTCPKIGVSRSR